MADFSRGSCRKIDSMEAGGRVERMNVSTMSSQRTDAFVGFKKNVTTDLTHCLLTA